MEAAGAAAAHAPRDGERRREGKEKKSKRGKEKKSKAKKSKEKHASKKRHKRRRSASRSASGSSSSSSGGGNSSSLDDVETPARELARLRDACEQLRALLRAHPGVRRDVRTLLWSVDAGQGVDLTPLPDATLRAALERLFATLRLQRTPAGPHVARPGAPPLLRAVGHVFDESLDAAPPPPAPPADPNGRHKLPIGPVKAPRAELVYSGPAPADIDTLDARSDSDDEGDADAAKRAPPPAAAARSPSPPAAPIGPAMPPPPAAHPADAAPRRVLGPAAPPAEFLAAAAALADEAVGPPPPELVAEADGASVESREAAVARVLRALAVPPAERDAYAVLGCAPDATPAEVKKAYWRASLLVHPDKCDHPRAAEAFAALARAKDELADATSRAALDARREDAALRAEFAAELAGKVAAARWRRSRGLAPLPGDELLLDGNPDARNKRDEWMTALPPEKQVRAGAPPVPTTSVVAFSRVERTGRGDTSEWTDTPAERAARSARNLLEGPAAARPQALMAAAEASAMGHTAALVDQYNAAKRPMSMLEAHQARLAAEAKAARKKAKREARGEGAAAAGAQPARAFNRDTDLAAPHKATTVTDVMQTLPGRFAGGSESKRRTFL